MELIITTNHSSDPGPVRELHLNRPPANALSPELIVALREAVEAAPKDGARALVLSGGPGMFSAGLDVPLLVALDRPAIAAAWRELYSLMRALACSPIPIAAAITGHGPAGGTVLALFCDWRGMAEGDWKMGFNEVQVGIPLPPVILSAHGEEQMKALLPQVHVDLIRNHTANGLGIGHEEHMLVRSARKRDAV